MNRRNFFGMMGALMAGAALGKKVDADPNHVGVFTVDRGWITESRWLNDGVIGWGNLNGLHVSSDDAIGLYGFVPGDTLVLNGSDIVGGNWFAEANAANGVPARKGDGVPADFDYYDAWL